MSDPLQGVYVFGDFCDGRVRALIRQREGSVTDPVDLGLQVDRLISFGEDEDGELYVLSLDGGVYRIVEDRDRGTPRASPRV